MNLGITDPYTSCPVYETGSFSLRLVRMDDAADLLRCYSDPESIPLFNSDNCLYGFSMNTLEEMGRCIEAWLAEFRARGFVRFSIVEQTSERVIGTVEFFTRKLGQGDEKGEAGILRLDLASEYEQSGVLSEMIELVEQQFPQHFTFSGLLTKAVKQAVQRVAVLQKLGYHKLERSEELPYEDYYIKVVQ
ncbi:MULTISPECIES: GNAT family N-acetyltransferase [unclassified Paenibacillus]|uniref:GNAT family N-acetyltransferase n=1 Tax=unclassified Paenibacillus TaxID=185978 RepID=UPI002406254A|nr:MULTISPECIES: GNAT family N-acetyltransferase [unclassified Paenibacillus]MDF9842282.1 RimJ/RimL family protein N-acetyltransferase [Paenibacillus sp. PastF-2]MDF9848841.1 RimJ/RimL family protein N-acetyltransferase [Paenibacillus sp. PastM-2]MDF9855411.1 RimJ/RimL family protein N-acetyltransferase [Paenibacillus sp. PastF-1]MDH6480713.1 RimJ/RimL family protein N-acetyltransferase [Paenibacillus sp. PastH-2]MDH6508106.1 RimJ/RimL family protein N-acetyltransferase [Paenibacillus sp. Past